jgi:hypothetical protein
MPFLISVLAALMLVGCAPAARPTPPPTPTFQPSSTPTLIVPAPQAPTSVPPQPTAVSSKFWVAYASGLASNFTKGDICSLEQPFVLEGDALPVCSGLVASFAPTGPTTGNYTFTNNILDGACVDSSSGTYVVTFYTAAEGDIIMTGVATRVCGGVTVFSQTTETRVAIRERPGSTCP